MLIEFTVENFRSYRESKTFSLFASSGKELPDNVIELDSDVRVLRTAAVYGPNASGKSNLLMAMQCLGDLVVAPLNRSIRTQMPTMPFALDDDVSDKGMASRFAAKFLADGVLYEYEVRLGSAKVEFEKLTAYPLGRKQEWFVRNNDEIKFNPTYLKGQKQKLRELTPSDTLFLAVAAAFRHSQLSTPADWLANNLRDRLGDNFLRWNHPVKLYEASARMAHDDHAFREWASAVLRYADIGIQNLRIQVYEERPANPEKTPDGDKDGVRDHSPKRHYSPVFLHRGVNGDFELYAWSESLGTLRLFGMLAPLYTVLQQGEVAIMDELSASLHPLMVLQILKMFNNAEINKRNAQLIFATHDATLLNCELFRRDQIWFTEKNESGATDLYSLHDIKGVREHDSFEKGYLRGRYGAIPFFGEFNLPEIPDRIPQAQEVQAGESNEEEA